MSQQSVGGGQRTEWCGGALSRASAERDWRSI